MSDNKSNANIFNPDTNKSLSNFVINHPLHSEMSILYFSNDIQSNSIADAMAIKFSQLLVEFGELLKISRDISVDFNLSEQNIVLELIDALYYIRSFFISSMHLINTENYFAKEDSTTFFKNLTSDVLEKATITKHEFDAMQFDISFTSEKELIANLIVAGSDILNAIRGQVHNADKPISFANFFDGISNLLVTGINIANLIDTRFEQTEKTEEFIKSINDKYARINLYYNKINSKFTKDAYDDLIDDSSHEEHGNFFNNMIRKTS